MTQTLSDFVLSAISGKTKVPTANKSGGKIIEYVSSLSANDVEAIAAEAINRDIVDPTKTSWDQLIIQIKSIAGKR